jgi:spore maturation protein CgeB
MRILILNSDTDEFLRWFYKPGAGLDIAPYATQAKARYESLYGMADFYSRSFKARGHEAVEIFPNNVWLQTAWARDKGINVEQPPLSILREDSDLIAKARRRLRSHKTWLLPLARRLGLVRTISDQARHILLSQVEEMRPDIIINQSISTVGAETARRMQAKGRTLIVQQGIDLPTGTDLSPYDIGISMLQHVVDRFRQYGLYADQVHLGFEPSILDHFRSPAAKDISVCFVGNLAASHGARIKMLEGIAAQCEISLWLPNLKGIPTRSPLRGSYKGQAWGRGMYEILRRSKIVWNSHTDDARGAAGNMRLFEATGIGSFLLTDHASNLNTLFEPGKHLATYNNVNDCIEQIHHFLARDEERDRIARQGQAWTLGRHSYAHRVEQILQVMERYHGSRA